MLTCTSCGSTDATCCGERHMVDPDDIVDVLRDFPAIDPYNTIIRVDQTERGYCLIPDETRENAVKEIERLRAALKPFAEVADDFDADGRELKDSDGIYANTAGDFRRAREALGVGNEQAGTGETK